MGKSILRAFFTIFGILEQFLVLLVGIAYTFLELGVGYHTPGIIKYLFWQMTEGNPKAVYACLNMGDAVCPNGIRWRSIASRSDALSTIIKKIPVSLI